MLFIKSMFFENLFKMLTICEQPRKSCKRIKPTLKDKENITSENKKCQTMYYGKQNSSVEKQKENTSEEGQPR
jgi:hypothetical protein